MLTVTFIHQEIEEFHFHTKTFRKTAQLHKAFRTQVFIQHSERNNGNKQLLPNNKKQKLHVESY